jgi:phosphoglycerate dehydrogenase-like enzyme
MGTPDAVVLSRGGRAMGLAEQAGALELCFVDNGLPLDEQVAQCGETPVLIISGKPDTALEVARRLPKLVLIQTFTVGTDWIDVKALAAMGIQVSDNNGANAVAVAEQTIALIYSVYQKLDQQFNSAKAGIWLEGVDLAWDEFHTLENKRVGLIGLGRIGSRVAKRLAGWECEVVFHDTADLDEEYVAATGARRLGYDELLQTSDVVSLHVPLNRLTRGMFTDREFGLMKKKLSSSTPAAVPSSMRPR